MHIVTIIQLHPVLSLLQCPILALQRSRVDWIGELLEPAGEEVLFLGSSSLRNGDGLVGGRLESEVRGREETSRYSSPLRQWPYSKTSVLSARTS